LGFVEGMIYLNEDGSDGEGSKFINSENGDYKNIATNNKDGYGNDISVCLSTQNEVGLIYKTTIPTQKKVLLLWHETHDHMISLAGSEHLASSIMGAIMVRCFSFLQM
jgi:hypothetical protein